MTTNMKPADELLSVRNQIKELQAREAVLKAGMKSGEMDMDGNFAIARFVKRKTSRFDKKAAQEELGDLSRFNVEGETSALVVEELATEVLEA